VAYVMFAGCAACALLVASALGRRGLALPPDPPSAGSGGSGAFHLLAAPQMRAIYAVGILLAAAWDLFTFVLPIHGTRLGFSASTIGLILGCFAVATFIVRLAMPWLMRRLNEWQILLGALLLSALCYAAFPLLRTPAALMLAAAALGLAVGASQPNMLALLHRHAPPGRVGEAFGVRVTIGNACQVALPLAFGAAGAALGMGIVFWSMAALIGSGVPLAWRRR